MTDRARGLLDTSVLVDFDLVDPEALPESSAVAAVTLAEPAAGPHATNDPAERARRQDRLQWVSATWDPLPFDADAARAYARVYAEMRASGRTSRARLADLLIAATALAHELPVYTRNAADFAPLERLASVVPVATARLR